jgi:hypothetical protein
MIQKPYRETMNKAETRFVQPLTLPRITLQHTKVRRTKKKDTINLYLSPSFPLLCALC